MPAMWLIGGSAALNAGSSIFSSLLGSSGAKKSAEAIRYAADKASQTALELNKRSRADLAPFRDLGVQSGAMLSDLFSGKANISDTYKASSLYDFQSELGTRALNRQLSARGMSGSGAGLESLALFDKSLVAEEGERYFNKLFGVTQLGENAAAQQASNTTSTGNTLADIQLKAGMDIGRAYQNQYNMLGAGVVGVGGAVRGGISDYLSMQYLDRFFPPNTTGSGTVTSGIPYDTVNLRGVGGQPSFQTAEFSTFN